MEWKDESATDWKPRRGQDSEMGAVMTESVVPAYDCDLHTELGWVLRHINSGRVEGSNSLYSELGGCAMLIENIKIWLK